MTLNEYVEKLLREGKRIEHPHFQDLIRIYGRTSIESKAEAVLEKYRLQQGSGDDDSHREEES
jgi:hypothetical protein